ncbi:MAG: PQQ-binding-like beta-propeller repeat protein [Candidatus Acidiferrales bacterium]
MTLARTACQFLAVSAMAAAALSSGAAPQAGPARAFSSAQVNMGRVLYQQKCASCHLPDLRGGVEAPPLAGDNFLNAWRKRTTSDLFAVIGKTMPANSPGSLSNQQSLSLIAFILQSNGAAAGADDLAADAAVMIGDLTTGAPASAPSGPPGAPGTPRAAEAPVGLTVKGEVKNYVPVTTDMLLHPNPADWLVVRGNYQSWNHSSLSQITPQNVGDLRLAWVWSMNEGYANQPQPLVHNGIMYLFNTDNIVQALDARTGDLIWENHIRPTGLQGGGTGAIRNLAIYNDKVFVPTTDAHLAALDARTGKTVWDIAMGDYTKGLGNSSGPIVIHGKVLQGITGCDRYKANPDEQGCFISAYDPDTGGLLWRFNTIAKSGEPGGDTWGKLPNMLRAGGETWITGSYDPELNLTYWGVAQPKPWMQVARGSSAADRDLFTSCTLALRPDDGSLVWYFQHVAGETLDLDEVYERVLVDIGDLKAAFTIGKAGILWKLDRQTGKFLAEHETIYQNVFSGVDAKTGKLTYRPDIIEQKLGEGVQVCPGMQGGHGWQSMSYYPQGGLLIIPLAQSCMEMTSRKVEFEDGSGGGAATEKHFQMPGTHGNIGKLAAYDVKTLKQVWTVEQHSTFQTAVLTTDTGLAWVGDLDRYFRALDANTGATIWQTRLGNSVQGFPVTYSVDGKQYIAVSTGVHHVPVLPDVHQPPHGNTLYVFALPDKK